VNTPKVRPDDALERWVQVPHHSGYEVSSLGRVRSVDRVIADKNGKARKLRSTILKPCEQRGYLRVNIAGSRLVHALVLEAFVGPRPPGHETCHNNGDRSDNRLSNLRWDTSAANSADIIRHGRNGMHARTHCPRGHSLREPNLVAYQRVRGQRGCRACGWARSQRQRLQKKNQNVVVDLNQLADVCYARLLTQYQEVA
jgi:hypothetical protein